MSVRTKMRAHRTNRPHYEGEQCPTESCLLGGGQLETVDPQTMQHHDTRVRKGHSRWELQLFLTSLAHVGRRTLLSGGIWVALAGLTAHLNRPSGTVISRLLASTEPRTVFLVRLRRVRHRRLLAPNRGLERRIDVAVGDLADAGARHGRMERRRPPQRTHPPRGPRVELHRDGLHRPDRRTRCRPLHGNGRRQLRLSTRWQRP